MQQRDHRHAAERQLAEKDVTAETNAERLRHVRQELEAMQQQQHALEVRQKKAELRAEQATELHDKIARDCGSMAEKPVETKAKHVQSQAQRTHAQMHVEKLRTALARCRGEMAVLAAQLSETEETVGALRGKVHQQEKQLAQRAGVTATMKEATLPGESKRTEAAERAAAESRAQVHHVHNL